MQCIKLACWALLAISIIIQTNISQAFAASSDYKEIANLLSLERDDLCKKARNNDLLNLNNELEEDLSKALILMIEGACKKSIISLDFRKDEICSVRKIITKEYFDRIIEFSYLLSQDKDDLVSYGFHCFEFGENKNESIDIFYSEFSKKIKSSIEYVYFDDIKAEEINIVGVTIYNNLRVKNSTVRRFYVYQTDLRGNFVVDDSKFDELEVSRSKILYDLSITNVDIEERYVLSNLEINGILSTKTPKIRVQNRADYFTPINPYSIRSLKVRGKFTSYGLTVSGGIYFANALFDVDIFELNSVKTKSLSFYNSRIASGYIEMAHANIQDHLSVLDSIFIGDVNLTGLETRKFYLQGSRLSGNTIVYGCKINILLFGNYRSYISIMLDTMHLEYESITSVKGDLDLTLCTFDHAFIENGEINQLVFIGVQVSGTVSISAKIHRRADFSYARAERGLFLHGSQWTPSSRLILIGLKTPHILGDYDDISFLKDNSRYFVKTYFDGIEFQYISSRLKSNDSERAPTSITSATSGQWSSAERMSLSRDTEFMQLNIESPDQHHNTGGGIDRMPADKIIEWLQSGDVTFESNNFNPQPFVMMAAALKSAGHINTSNDINEFRVSMTLSHGNSSLDLVKSWIGIFVGYGYKLDRPMLALIIFFVLGLSILAINDVLEYKKRYNDLKITDKAVSMSLINIAKSAAYESFIRLSPNVANLYSQPQCSAHSWFEPWPEFLKSYLRLHTFAGAVSIFLLITPIVGFFD